MVGTDFVPVSLLQRLQVTTSMMKISAGTTKYETYAARLAKLLRNERSMGIWLSNPSENALPLCMLINSMEEQTLYEGLEEIFERVNAEYHNNSGEHKTYLEEASSYSDQMCTSIAKAQNDLIAKLLIFGALERILDLVLNPSNCGQVIDISISLLCIFARHKDGISRLTCRAEQEFQNLGFTNSSTLESARVSDTSRVLQMIDVLVYLQGSSNFIMSMVHDLVLGGQLQRISAFFLHSLSAAAHFSGIRQHSLSRKVSRAIKSNLMSRLFKFTPKHSVLRIFNMSKCNDITFAAVYSLV